MIASKIVSQKKSFTYEAFYFYFWFFSITAIFVDIFFVAVKKLC